MLPSFIFCSCKEDLCNNVDTGSIGYTEITFINKETGKPLIQDEIGKYGKDDLNLSNADGTPRYYFLRKMKDENYGGQTYYVFYSSTLGENQSEIPINELINERVFLDFKNDRDTIDYSYKIKKIACGGSIFDEISVRYNGILMGEFRDDFGPSITIVK